MAQDNRNVATRAFLKNLASGGVAIIPVIGPLLKAAIFDTYNEIDAMAESAKVDKTLAGIQNSLQGQSVEIAEVIVSLNTAAGFRDETKTLVNNLGAVMGDAETATVSEQLEQAVINFRFSLVEQLYGASNASLNQLVVVLPGASNNVSDQATKLDRVNQLVEWAESTTGPGLDQLVLAATRLRLFPNFSSDPPSASAEPLPLRGIEVFYSYSHRDEALRDELENHLNILQRQGVITNWHDRRIGAGNEFKGRIDEHLNTAQIILLLISSDFLASDYCYDIEMEQAIDRHEAGEARVIPVIIRDCLWTDSRFGKLLALPRDGKPVTSWPNRDEAFTDVARGIRRAARALIEVKQQSRPADKDLG